MFHPPDFDIQSRLPERAPFGRNRRYAPWIGGEPEKFLILSRSCDHRLGPHSAERPMQRRFRRMNAKASRAFLRCPSHPGNPLLSTRKKGAILGT
jgi:hypothetical protein